MANITPYITAIRTARYGEDVRGSIADALTAVNDQVEDDTESAGTYAANASNAATAAAASATSASQTAAGLAGEIENLHDLENSVNTAEQSRVTAEQSRVTAEQARANAATNYVAQARAYAEQASQYASSDNAMLSRSWAVGGTGSRYGEDTNNARYWADVAASVVTEGGVASFNSRTGNVIPTEGDYSASLISRGTGTVETALQSLEGVLNNLVGISVNGSSHVVITYNEVI